MAEMGWILEIHQKKKILPKSIDYTHFFQKSRSFSKKQFLSEIHASLKSYDVKKFQPPSFPLKTFFHLVWKEKNLKKKILKLSP